jgi:hypothetical protein
MAYPNIHYTVHRKYPHLVYNPLLGASFQIVAVEPCELVSPKYYDLLSWFNIPLPDYSFAIEPEAKERKIDAVLQQLKDGVANIQESAVFREFLTTMSKFWQYSIGNQILIMLQKPNATHVAGFVSWKENFERHVKSAEKAISILAPCLPSKGFGFPEEIWRTSGGKEYLLRGKYVYEPVNGQKLVKPFETRALAISWLKEQGAEKESEREMTEIVPTRFKVVSVFDVSQTEGKPLPEFVVPVLTGAANEGLFTQLLVLDKAEGLEVSFEPKPELSPEIKGYYIGKFIWVKPDESRAQQLKTLLHETAHYYTESVFLIPKSDAETIAESCAFVAGAHFGFDTGTRSFPYVALWAKDKKVLDANLENIRKISSRIIEALEQQVVPSTLKEVPVAEPWQMTKGEWLTQNEKFGYHTEELASEYHRGFVSEALSEGKPVPPEVLKDYPELATASTLKENELYRAWVWPIVNGHWQENQKRWEYTQAVSPEEAGHNLRQHFPPPNWHVDPVILDKRGIKKPSLLAEQSVDFFSLGKELESYVPGFKVEVLELPGKSLAFATGVGELDDRKKKVLIKLWEGATRKDALAVLAHEYSHLKEGTTEIEKGLTEPDVWQRGEKYAKKWGALAEYRRLAHDLVEYYSQIGSYPRITAGIKHWLEAQREVSYSKEVDPWQMTREEFRQTGITAEAMVALPNREAIQAELQKIFGSYEDLEKMDAGKIPTTIESDVSMDYMADIEYAAVTRDLEETRELLEGAYNEIYKMYKEGAALEEKLSPTSKIPRGSLSDKYRASITRIRRIQVPAMPSTLKELVKEPWQMTRTEWNDAHWENRYISLGDSLSDAEKTKRAKETTRLEYGIYRSGRAGEGVYHEQVVKKALSEGKPIPPEVLREYPNLKPLEKPSSLLAEQPPSGRQVHIIKTGTLLSWEDWQKELERYQHWNITPPEIEEITEGHSEEEHIYKVPEWPEVKGVFVGGCVERGPGSSFRAKAHAHNDKSGEYFGWICVRSFKRVGEVQGDVITKPSRLLWHEYTHILTPNHFHDDIWRHKMSELGQPIPKQYEKKKRVYQGYYHTRRYCPKCRQYVDITSFNAPPGRTCPQCGTVTLSQEM